MCVCVCVCVRERVERANVNMNVLFRQRDIIEKRMEEGREGREGRGLASPGLRFIQGVQILTERGNDALIFVGVLAEDVLRSGGRGVCSYTYTYTLESTP